jgi:hypothetical protein
MSQVEMKPNLMDESADPRWKALYKSGGIAALAQIGCAIASSIIAFGVGVEPITAEEYFTILGQDRVAGLLRLDFTTMFNVLLFTLTSFAIFAALPRKIKMYAGLGAALVFVGVALGLAKHSAFSMIHLAAQYAAATTEAQKTMLMAAGEAVVASDWWNSTGGFFSGLFLQGGMAYLSLLMLRGKTFSKGAALSGLLGNGLDWVHVLVNLVLPGVADVMLYVGGVFYVAWYILLGRDLLRLGKQAE